MLFLLPEVRARNPQAVSVIATGSWVLREPRNNVADLDIVLLDPSVEEGALRESAFTIADTTVDLISYHPLHFIAVASESVLTLAWLREIRKLLFGRVLYDNGQALLTLGAIRSARLPNYWLSEILVQLRVLWKEAKDTGTYGYEFFRALELAIFLRMNSRVQICYFKHKYLVEDARKLDLSVLSEIIEKTTSTFLNDREWPNSAREIALQLNVHAGLHQGIGGLCQDLESLTQQGNVMPSVLVARLGLLRSVCSKPDWARRTPNNIRIAFDHAFMQGKVCNAGMTSMMDTLIQETASLLLDSKQ